MRRGENRASHGEGGPQVSVADAGMPSEWMVMDRGSGKGV